MRQVRKWAACILPLLMAGFVACDSATGVEGGDGSLFSRTHGNGNGERCTGTIGPVTVDNVTVPAGATCVLEGTRVRGNVLVRRDATLIADGADIDGNIQAEDAFRVETRDGTFVGGNIQVKRRAFVRVENTFIDGDLQVEESGADLEVFGTDIDGNLQLKKAGSGRIEDTFVNGDIQLELNTGPLGAEDNVVRGNMQVFKNVGGVALVGNRIAQALQCKENRPPPVGGGNLAGDYEDQCEVL